MRSLALNCGLSLLSLTIPTTMHTNKLLWSALSRTLDPTSTSTVVDEVTSVVAKELENRGVVIGTRER